MEKQKQFSEKDKAFYSKMFQDPAISTDLQLITLVSGFTDPENKWYPKPTKTEVFSVTDKSNVNQLRERWYKKNVQYDEATENTAERYVILYVDENVDTQDPLSFAIYDFLTMEQVKRNIGKTKLTKEVVFRVYEEWTCPFNTDQSALNYQTFQKNHMSDNIETPIKIIGQQRQHYFYAKSNLSTTLAQLKAQIQTRLLDKQSPVQYENGTQFQMIINNTKFSSFIGKPKLLLQKIRNVYAPGQIINIKFNKKLKEKKKQNIKNDFIIEIVTHQKTQNQNTDSKIVLKKKVITKKYSQVYNIKISTILKQENIPDQLLTSISVQGQIIKPFQKFSQIEKQKNIKLPQNQNDKLLCICIPQNFLYYHELDSFQKTGVSINMDEILERIQKSKSVQLTPQHRKQYKQKRDKKRIDLVHVDQELKNQLFLDPIITYTADQIYRQLNRFLRETSISLFSKQDVAKKYWAYPFSQKLIKSLLKLPNHNGIVFRCTSGVDFGYKQNDVFQWNSFNSTSTDRKKSQFFLWGAKSSPHLFEIQTFSGKQISNFSYIQGQKQVLILPYTKFIVKEIRTQKNPDPKKPELKFLKLIQLPIAKKVPGNIIVWIDSNIHQNSIYFNQMIKQFNLKDFDLIQLISNSHFILWLNQFKHVLQLPNVKVRFITNMNRTPERKGQGIQTLNIIRSFKPDATVIFFIGDKQATKKRLQDANVKNFQKIIIQNNQQKLKNHILNICMDGKQIKQHMQYNELYKSKKGEQKNQLNKKASIKIDNSNQLKLELNKQKTKLNKTVDSYPSATNNINYKPSAGGKSGKSKDCQIY